MTIVSHFQDKDQSRDTLEHKPQSPPVNFDAIPDELKALRRWVLWRYRFRRGKDGEPGKWTKPPLDARRGRYAKVNDPDTWTTFDEARAAYEEERFDCDGIGFMLAPGDPYVVIDLDDCIDRGGMEGYALAIVEACGKPYTEFSPSGRGVHIWVKADMAAGTNQRNGWPVEAYGEGRYLTVTGDAYTFDHEIRPAQEAVAALLRLIETYRYDEVRGRVAELLAEEVANPTAVADPEPIAKAEPEPEPVATVAPVEPDWMSDPAFTAASPSPVGFDGGEEGNPQEEGTPTRSARPVGSALDDDEVIAKAMRGEYKERFRRLMDGDTSDYPSPSQADMALMNDLRYWTGGDVAQMKRIAYRSGLRRPKWDEPRGKHGTYLDMTIAEAMESSAPVYDPNYRSVGYRGPAKVKPNGKANGQAQGKATGEGKASADDWPASFEAWPYRVEHGVTYKLKAKRTKDGEEVERVRVANFAARVVSQSRTEDGETLLTVEGVIEGGRPFQLDAPADVIADPRKLRKAFIDAAGAKAVIMPRMTDHLRAAIQLSAPDDIPTYERFERTGWKGDRFIIGGRLPENATLHLPPKLAYHIPADADLAKGLQGLRLLFEAFPAKRLILPLVFAFGAPLARIAPTRVSRHALHIVGPTGAMKTTAAQLIMSLFGPDFLREDVLTKFGHGATRNAIMHLAAHAHDMPFMIDNYKPNVGKGASDFIAVIHQIVEGSDRDRLTRSASLRRSRLIHCWPLTTGEDIPTGDTATVARMLVVPFDWQEDGEHNVNLAALTELQLEYADHLAAVGGAWLDWLESPQGRKAASATLADLRQRQHAWGETIHTISRLTANPLRIAANAAYNALAFELSLQHPDLGPILEPHRKAYEAGLWEAVELTAGSAVEALEAVRFLDAVRELLDSGRYFLKPAGQPGVDPREADRLLGWHGRDEDGEEVVYMPPAAIQSVLKEYGQGHLSNVRKDKVYKQLKADGVIARTGGDNKTLIQKWIGGQNRRVLCLRKSAIMDDNQPKS